MRRTEGHPHEFSIRDLLLVTVIVAMALGWWLDRNPLAKRARDADSLEVVNDYLVGSLREKNPIIRIDVSVNGRDIVGEEQLGNIPNPQAPAANP